MKRFARSMTTKLTMRAAIALVGVSAGATWCLATPYAGISSGGPLIQIWVGNDLSCQAQHFFDAPDYEFYPAGEGLNLKPGDYGTFIAMNGMLYAPDFVNHDLTATGSIGFYTPFTQVSQTAVTGSGVTPDPFKVVTVVDVAQTGLVVQQTDTYVVGDEFFTTDVMISNNAFAKVWFSIAVASMVRSKVTALPALNLYLGESDPRPAASPKSTSGKS